MKYVDEYRAKDLILSLAVMLKSVSEKEMVFMEVCGGHTMAIHRFGLPALLPVNIRLISGPGCPVCVSGRQFIDYIIETGRQKDVIITTFGDLIRVPGSGSSLEKERASGSDVRIIYSVLEALEIARRNRNKKIVFPAIGFETTAPSTAAVLLKAKEDNFTNFYVLSAHKIMPPVMNALVNDGVKINGFIAPGHVTAITGTEMYTGLVKKHRLGVVVSGFEPADLMQSVLMLARQVESGSPEVEIQYRRVVSKEGNIKAKKICDEVFEPRDDEWRGLGIIPGSGLKINSDFSRFDAEKHFNIEIKQTPEPAGCICGEILRGLKTPRECTLFGLTCTPSNPVGACMVSAEGTCATYYKYRS